jgi:protein AroM
VRPLVQPQPLLLGALRAMRWSGRLGVVTPSVPHVPQTTERWRRDGFDPLVVALSPYEEEDANAIARVAGAFRDAGVGLIAMDCMGFRRKTRDELRGLTGAPVLLANLLVARVLGELCGG